VRKERAAVSFQLSAFSKKNGAWFLIGGHSVQISRCGLNRASRGGAGYFLNKDNSRDFVQFSFFSLGGWLQTK
jgi:hypothetical protein